MLCAAWLQLEPDALLAASSIRSAPPLPGLLLLPLLAALAALAALLAVLAAQLAALLAALLAAQLVLLRCDWRRMAASDDGLL